MSRRVLSRLCLSVLSSTTLFSGCAFTPAAPSRVEPQGSVAVTGVVRGGQQPIIGAKVQLYAADPYFGGAQALALLPLPLMTDQQGVYRLTTGLVCPATDPLVYVIETGGNPGLAAGTNPALTLLTAIGHCSSLTGGLTVVSNELTTVAAVAALSPFMKSAQQIGSSYSSQQLLANGFQTAAQLVSLVSGTAPGSGAPANIQALSAKVNTLGNVIAGCINSSGGFAGDGSVCGSLFALTSASGSVPADTASALLALMQSPQQHVSELFDLASASPPFLPALTSPPADWSLLSVPTPSPAPTLPQQSSLVAQYLLGEGAGSIAHDSSGHGNHATLNGGLWEGIHGINFDQQGAFLQLPVTLNSSRTWQFAVFNPPFGSAVLPQTPGYGGLSQFPGSPTLLCGNDKDHLCLIANSIFGPRAIRLLAFNTDQTEAGVVFPYGWHILTYVCGSALPGGSVVPTRIFYDGAEVGSYIHQGEAATCPSPVTGNYQIGGSAQFNGTWFVGKIAAAWAWSTQLTTTEAAQAAAYAQTLLSSRGVQTIFSDVVNTAPVLIGGLDSRTEGAGVTSSTVWLETMQTDVTFIRRNLAHGGETAFDACAQFDATYAEQIGSSGQPVIVALWGGVNDGSQTPQQIADSLQCMATKAKAKGARVILATEVSAYSSQGTVNDTRKNQLNAILRAQAFTWGVDNLADLATDPQLGADGASANAACFPDGLHPGPLCEPDIAQIFGNAVNELTGSTAAAHHTSSATTYQELAADRFLDLTGNFTQTILLPDCIGYSLSRQILNKNATPASIGSGAGRVLTGDPMLQPRAVGVFTPVPGPSNSGGCSWKRVQ